MKTKEAAMTIRIYEYVNDRDGRAVYNEAYEQQRDGTESIDDFDIGDYVFVYEYWTDETDDSMWRVQSYTGDGIVNDKDELQREFFHGWRGPTVGSNFYYYHGVHEILGVTYDYDDGEDEDSEGGGWYKEVTLGADIAADWDDED